MGLCVVQFQLPLRAEYPRGGWDSSFLSQPAEWWEPGTGQPKMVCYFYHSVLNVRAAPWRPVAGSSPQAAEFNPRTALPRCDGKHLASCLTTRPGRPASMLLTPYFSVPANPLLILLINSNRDPHRNVRFNNVMHWWLLSTVVCWLRATWKDCTSFFQYWFRVKSVSHE